MHSKTPIDRKIGRPKNCEGNGYNIMNRRILSLALALVIALTVYTPATATTTVTASPTASTVLVNDLRTVFEAYNINGNNYFKLRDLALALNDTGKQFEIGWDGATNAITLTSGQTYTANGNEVSGKSTSEKTAIPTTAKVFLDGKEVRFTAYNIDDSNYFKLRDVGQAFNFGVDWDGTRNAIVIDTNKDYTPEPPPPPTTLLAETDDMGQVYLDKIIFLGDSTTYGMLAYGVLSGGTQTKQVWTPFNGTFSLFNQSNILIRYPDTSQDITIESAVVLKKPEYMVITLGVNGVAFMDEEYFKSEYRAMITRIQEANADTKIILNSMYPVARTYGSLSSINNEKITTANGWVYALADEMGLRYLDSASVLKDSEGWLPASYQNGDGLHLTGDTFYLVLNYIRTHGYR